MHAPPVRSAAASLRWILRGGRATYVGVALVLVFAIFASPRFARPDNLLDLVRRASYLGVVALGQTVVIVTGGVDLSVGETISLSALLITEVTLGRSGMAVPAILLALGMGLAVGLVNGLAVTRLKLPPVVVTLAMMITLKGVYLLYCNAAPRGLAPASIRFWATERIAGIIPVAALTWVFVGLLVWFALYRTAYGRRLYATGGNPLATWVAGVRTDAVVVSAYMIAGVAAALSGILLAGFVGYGVVGAGDTYMMNSVAAAILGGATFAGARGSVFGTTGGALFMTLLLSLLTVLGLQYSAKLMAQGLVLLLIVYAYSRQAGRSGA